MILCPALSIIFCLPCSLVLLAVDLVAQLMELVDSGLPFWWRMQIEDLDHALTLVIEVDKLLAILLMATDVLLVPGTSWKDQDSALWSWCWSGHEVICL